MRPQVGVDIGSTEVRVVEVSGLDKDGYARVRRIGTAPLRKDAVVAGQIRSRETVAHALVNALEAADLRKAPLVIGLASPDAAVARFPLPSAVRPAERSSTIRTLGRPISPTVAVDQSVITSNLVSQAMQGEARFDNLVVSAAAQESVDAIRDVCRLAKVQIRAIDLAAAATMRALTRWQGSEFEIATVVDIGATKVCVATRQGAHLRSVRTGKPAGESVTQAIITGTNATWEEAELQKAHVRLSDAPRDEPMQLNAGYGIEVQAESDFSRRTAVEEILVAAVEPILDQVVQAVESDATNGGTFTQSVTMCGLSSRIRGLREAMQQRLGVPVSVGSPWASLEPSRRNQQFFDGGIEDPTTMLRIATAVGLALWREL